MFTESFRKKIAKFLLVIMLVTNISPVFAMQRPDYQVTVQRRNVLNDVTGCMTPYLFIEAFKLTEQMVSDVSTMIYQSICSQMIMMSMIMLQIAKTASEISERFVIIDGLGKIRIDENDSIVLDPSMLLDPTKTVEFTTDRSVIIDSLRCNSISVVAPSVTVRGNTFIKSLDISLGENGVFAIDTSSTLSTESVVIDGMIHNYGTLNFLEGADAILRSNQSVLLNQGLVKGNRFALENIGAFLNKGDIRGVFIGLQSNFLQNDGTIGGTESILDLMIHKSIINNRDISGKRAKVVLTSDEKGFLNRGSIDISNTELQISGTFKNEGTTEFGILTGFVSKFLNKGTFESNYGSLSIDTGENHHILKLCCFTSAGDFLNTFTDQYSTMKVESFLGTGKLFNRSAFEMLGAGAFGIRELYNQNAEFIARYGCSSFGNTVRFVSSLGKIVNEGSLVADTLSFDDTEAIITNAPAALIKTAHEMKGRVKSVDNLGTIVSEHSFISLMFDTFVHRGKLKAAKGVSFIGKVFRNYSDLSLHSSKIERLFNGESITDDVDDAFFAEGVTTAATKASNIATMPIIQRKHAVTGILQKAKAMNVLQEEIDKVEAYCGSITSIVLPGNVPALRAMINRDYPHLIQGKLPRNMPALRTLICGSAAYRQKLAELEAIPFPLAELTKIIATIIPATDIAAMPIAQRREAIADILQKARTMNMMQEEIAKVQHYCDLLPAEQHSGQLRTLADRLRSSQLTITPFPMIELNKLISAYNKRSIPKTAANLWMYFGSDIGRLENTGHVQFIKGLHAIDTYMGTAESEFLVPKLDDLTLPITNIQPLQIAEPVSPDAFQTSDTNDDPDSVTKVTEKKLEGAGKIQAPKMRITDWDLIDRFSLLTDELETITAGFVNTKEIVLPRTKLVFDLLTKDFENTGSIACLEFLVRNCGIFRNQSRIETHADIDVTAREVWNAGDPTLTPKSTYSVAHKSFVYQNLSRGQQQFFLDGSSGDFRFLADGGVYPYLSANTFNFYQIGAGLLRSHAGAVKLSGTDLIKNEFSFIAAANHFVLSSPTGTINNRIGNIFSASTDPSYIETTVFEHFSGDAQDIQTGSCRLVWTSCGKYVGERTQPIYATFNTSDKPKIQSGGDLHIRTSQSPVIKGADILSGGTIHAEFPGAKFQAEPVHQLAPEIKAHNEIILNGQDIGIKGAMFLAGFGIALSATGEIIIANPDGQQYIIPPKGSLDINVGELARKSYGHMVTAPMLKHDLSLASTYHMNLDPTAGMRRLFFGNAPDPMKRLVFDTRIMSTLPMILGDYATLLGTQTLNTPKFLSLLERNAQDLDGALILSDQIPNKLLMYFTIKDLDDETQEAEPHIHIPEGAFNTLRQRFAIEAEQGPVLMEGSNINLKNAVLKGTSIELIARKDPTVPSTGKTSIVASQITATEDKVRIHADKEVDVSGRYDKTQHHFSIDGGHAMTETAVHAPAIITAPQEVIISGEVSEIRGTLIKTRKFIDETERLLIGVDKTALHYWSHAEKESGGMLGGSSSIERHGYQEIAHPSILEVEEMLSRSGQSLIFESVIAEGLQRLLVEKSTFHETSATLHSHDETKVSSSGFSLFGMGGAPSIPKDPLVRAWQDLRRAANSKALIAEAIKTAASIYGSVDDAKNLFNAVTLGISLDTASVIAGTFAKRYLNLGISFGSQTTTTISHQTQQLPNKISAELIELRCPTAVHLQGHHEARDMIIETESFTTTDIVSTATIDSKTESSGGSFNPVSAVVGSFFPGMIVGMGTAMIGSVSGSISDVTQTQRQTMRTPTTVVADRFILRAGNAHLTDTQIRARLVDAIITGDLVIESLTNEFFSETSGGNFGTGLGFLSLVNGIQNMADAARVTTGMGGGIIDVKEIERKINEFTAIVGEEQFNLIVGGTLLARSAFYGQRDVASDILAPRMSATSTDPREHIEVGNAVHEIVPEEHIRQDDSYSIPVGDLFTVMSRLSLKEKAAKELYEEAIAAGKTPEEARKIANDISAEIAEDEYERIEIDVAALEKEAEEIKRLAPTQTVSQSLKTSITEETTHDQTAEILIDRVSSSDPLAPKSQSEMDAIRMLHTLRLPSDLTPQEKIAGFHPKNDIEAHLQRFTVLRHKVLEIMHEHPEATKRCLNILSMAASGWSAAQYLGAGIGGFSIGGPIGATLAVGQIHAVKEGTGFAIDTTVNTSSEFMAAQITSDPMLRKEFADTIKTMEIAGLCATLSGKKAATALASALKTQAKGFLQKFRPLAQRTVSYDPSSVKLGISTVVNKNSHTYTGECRLYEIYNARTGQVMKVGETARGYDTKGRLIRAQTQCNDAIKQFRGEFFDYREIGTYGGKAAVKAAETGTILHYRADNPTALPWNKGVH